jgi:hypothetical protein
MCLSYTISAARACDTAHQLCQSKRRNVQIEIPHYYRLPSSFPTLLIIYASIMTARRRIQPICLRSNPFRLPGFRSRPGLRSCCSQWPRNAGDHVKPRVLLARCEGGGMVGISIRKDGIFSSRHEGREPDAAWRHPRVGSLRRSCRRP